MLLPIERILNNEEVQQIRQTLTEIRWQEGKETAGNIARQVKHNFQADDEAVPSQQLSQSLLQRLSQHAHFISAALPEKIYPPKFNCYENSGHYGQHIDSAIMYLRDGQSLRTDVSATLFLSDPDTYEGGELMIETQYGAQAVKLNAGDMVLYPANSLHEVTPVTKGQRLCAFFWVQSLVRSNQQREYLFELDQSIQVLTQDRGTDDTEVRRLSGLYHNLLREWAQTT